MEQGKSNADATDNNQLDPLFRTVDGSNSPVADVSTPDARVRAYSMLLSKGLIRVGLQVPFNAEFTLEAADDPYGYAGSASLSLFRRPLSMANLRFVTDVQWDGRETVACAPLTQDLANQANTAAIQHAQATAPLSDHGRAQIVSVEAVLYFAQYEDTSAGNLFEDGASGGPVFLSQLPFYFGINAFGRSDPAGKAHNREAFDLYRAWAASPADTVKNQARLRIAQGEVLFNTHEFTVSGVSGFNDLFGQSEIRATCTSCHDTPNVGTNSERHLMDLGVSDEMRRTPDLPLYTFKNSSNGAVIRTTDPGRALITGKWADMSRFKVPGLRGLASRSPYLHNGAAATISDVIDYHDRRFGIGMTSGEKEALAAFLAAL
jgi:hypothetical protein